MVMDVDLSHFFILYRLICLKGNQHAVPDSVAIYHNLGRIDFSNLSFNVIYHDLYTLFLFPKIIYF